MIESDERHWWYRGRRLVVRAMLDRLPVGDDARLLDAGCGSGRMLDELARYGSAQGVELSELAAAVARRRGHQVTVGRIEQMPFGDGSFDLVTCLDVVEHTPDAARAAADHPPGRAASRDGSRLPGALVVA